MKPFLLIVAILFYSSAFAQQNAEQLSHAPVVSTPKTLSDNNTMLCDLPIHESQLEIERNEEYSIFELYVRPTYDLYQEVLRMGTQVEVLEPNYMREEIIEMISRMYNQYIK